MEPNSPELKAVKHWPEIVIDIPMLEIKNRTVHLNGPLGLKWLKEKVAARNLTEENREMLKEAIKGFDLDPNSLNYYMLIAPLYQAGVITTHNIDRIISRVELTSDFHLVGNPANPTNKPKTSSKRSPGLQVLDQLEDTGLLNPYQVRCVAAKKEELVAGIKSAVRSEFFRD